MGVILDDLCGPPAVPVSLRQGGHGRLTHTDVQRSSGGGDAARGPSEAATSQGALAAARAGGGEEPFSQSFPRRRPAGTPISDVQPPELREDGFRLF